MKRILILALPLLLSGCIVNTVAKTAVGVATLPFKVAGAAVDAATTSQAEADQNRGRKIRKEEERAGREAREREKTCAKAARRGEQCPPPSEQPGR